MKILFLAPDHDAVLLLGPQLPAEVLGRCPVGQGSDLHPVIEASVAQVGRLDGQIKIAQQARVALQQPLPPARGGLARGHRGQLDEHGPIVTTPRPAVPNPEPCLPWLPWQSERFGI